MNGSIHKPHQPDCHLLVDEEMRDFLRETLSEGVPLPLAGEMHSGALGGYSGIPIYLDECPCPEYLHIHYTCPNCGGLDGKHSGMDSCPTDPLWVQRRG